MHTIRSRARRVAWDSGDSKNSSFNPFAERRIRVFYDRTHDELPSRRARHSDDDRTSHAVAVPSAEEISPAPPQSDSVHLDASHEKQHEESELANVELGGAVQHARSRRKFMAVFKKHEDHFDPDDIREYERKLKFTVLNQLRKIFFNSWVHLLLLFIPAGFAVQYTHTSAVTVFSVNFVAMIPSIMVLAMAVDELILRVGELLGALISTTFSNASQLITSVLLLRSRQVTVLQISLIGAILSNLLFMTGLCFFLGGFHRMEQFFNITVAQSFSEMLLLAVLSLAVPTAARYLTHTTPAGIIQQSRGQSVVLLVSYGLYLLFSLKTHNAMYNAPSQKVPKKKSDKVEEGQASRGIAMIGAGTAAASGVHYRPYEDEEGDDEIEAPQLSLWTAIATLVVSTTLLTFNTLFATDSINGLLLEAGISETFLGIVILPILSNDPTTLVVAVKDKMDLTLTLTLGKCVQIALLVVPSIIILGWCMGVEEMTLDFGEFETVVMFASILVVNYIIQNGKSNWLVGALLIAAYIVVSIAAFFIP